MTMIILFPLWSYLAERANLSTQKIALEVFQMFFLKNNCWSLKPKRSEHAPDMLVRFESKILSLYLRLAQARFEKDETVSISFMDIIRIVFVVVLRWRLKDYV
jgi:hypothetical protein